MMMRLFIEFFKIGLFAVGGGMATIPFLYDLCEKTGWYTETELANMIAIGESTPGPIGVNMATYVGFQVKGVLGSIIATVGFVLPSVLIVIIVSVLLDRFRNNKTVDSAFYGLRPASSGLIAAATVSIFLLAFFPLGTFGGNWMNTIQFKAVILAFVLAVLTRIPKVRNLHPIVIILLSAIVGILFHFAA